MDIFAFIFAAGLGFGVAFWIASTLLNNSNNIGDYHADPKHYSASVHFTEKLEISARTAREGCIGFRKSTLPLAPRGSALVEKPKKITGSQETEPTPDTVSKPEPQKIPPRKNSSGFPRPFHDV